MSATQPAEQSTSIREQECDPPSDVYEETAKKMRKVLDSVHPFANDVRYWMVFDIDFTLIRVNSPERTLIVGSIISGIRPMISILNEYRAKGFGVAIITARDPALKWVTMTTLKQIGVRGWDILAFKPLLTSTATFKASVRKDIETKGGIILTNVGDQNADLEGGFALHTFKLPSCY